MGYNMTQKHSQQWSVEFYADAMGRIKVLEFINFLRPTSGLLLDTASSGSCVPEASGCSISLTQEDGL